MDRWRRGLALVLGVVFIVAGMAESIRAIRSGGGGLPFWFGSLCCGGALILVGTYALQHRAWLSFTVTAVGCLAAAIATMWTIILPLLALMILVLALRRALHLSEAASPSGTEDQYRLPQMPR